MKIAPFSPEQQALLNRFESRGGMVRFRRVLCDGPGEVPDRISTHRSAVLAAVPGVAPHGRIAVASANQRQVDSQQGADMVPECLSWPAFLGSRYDLERDGLIVHGKGRFRNDFFFHSDDAIQRNAYPLGTPDRESKTGFAYAFSDPPIGLALTHADIAALFDDVLHQILHGAQDSIILKWPFDWSEDFRAGDPWSGNALWSLAAPGRREIVVIAALATD